MSVSWHLIPDGISTIVEVEIKGEFTVSTVDASREAEAAMVPLVARLSGQTEAEIRAALEADRWTGSSWAPDEPPAGERHG